MPFLTTDTLLPSRATKPKSWRLGLRAFLLGVVAIGSVAGVLGRYLLDRPTYKMQTTHVSHDLATACWKTHRGKTRLHYAVFTARGAPVEMGGSWSEGPTDDTGLWSWGSELYMNGQRVPPKEGGQVFVYTQFQTLVPVTLTPSELAMIKPGELEKLPQTQIWKSKIEPLRKKYGFPG